MLDIPKHLLMIKNFLKMNFLLLIIFIGPIGYSQNGVTISDQGNTVILSNDFVQVILNKKRAYLSSIKYKGVEMVGKQRANWNIVAATDEFHDDEKLVRFSKKMSYNIRTNPSENNGERAEVSFKFKYENDTTTIPLDIDLRFTLGKQDKGVYLSAYFHHRPEYPEFKLGQGRMIVELNPAIFDFYTVDVNRKQKMASAFDVENGIKRNVKEAKLLTTGIRKGEVEHKYDYSAILAQTPTWGWTSTSKNIGFWMINPSFEYINGGPTQVGNTGHVEAILLNHWQDGHYGGAALTFKPNEDWKKFIGPFYFYCNSGANSDLMWKDAIKESKKQQLEWPFSWVKDKEYPLKQERGTLDGQIKINDPLTPTTAISNVWVGLAATDTNWQYEGKNYQFWVRADANGTFTIPNIRAGKYNLYAFADGILGEYKKTALTITSGSKLDIGTQVWTPIRYGKQLWEIGIHNRSASEFKHGDHYWQWGLYMLYPKEFPNDVNFTIGKSDWSKDWNYCQPTVIDADYAVVRGTKWNVNFDLAEPKKGKGTLRLAICGSRKGEIIYVSLNGKPIGNTGHLPEMGVMHRDGIRGKEVETNLTFDAQLLQKGKNTIQLSFDAKKWPFGVLYDYLRLELDDSK